MPISLYWQSRGKTGVDKQVGKTFRSSKGNLLCNECCTKLITQIDCPEHYHRDSCPYCLGTGTNSSCKDEEKMTEETPRGNQMIMCSTNEIAIGTFVAVVFIPITKIRFDPPKSAKVIKKVTYEDFANFWLNSNAKEIFSAWVQRNGPPPDLVLFYEISFLGNPPELL